MFYINIILEEIFKSLFSLMFPLSFSSTSFSVKGFDMIYDLLYLFNDLAMHICVDLFVTFYLLLFLYKELIEQIAKWEFWHNHQLNLECIFLNEVLHFQIWYVLFRYLLSELKELYNIYINQFIWRKQWLKNPQTSKVLLKNRKNILI